MLNTDCAFLFELRRARFAISCCLGTQSFDVLLRRYVLKRLVEVTGLEPATYCLQSSRSPSWATPPKPEGRWIFLHQLWVLCSAMQRFGVPLPEHPAIYRLLCIRQCLACDLVGLVGLEPTTPALSTQCSNQLSYRPKPVTLNLDFHPGSQWLPSNNR